MIKPVQRFLGVAFVLTLTACSSTPEKVAVTSTSPSSRPKLTVGQSPADASASKEKPAVNALLLYAMRLGKLPLDQQKKELAQVMQSLNRNKKDPENRLKAALIYSLPSSRLHDNAKAIALWSELQREKEAEEDVAALVDLLRDVVEERQRADENLARLNQKVRDEQRRSDDLQAKLDALKNIEKTLIDRNQGTNK